MANEVTRQPAPPQHFSFSDMERMAVTVANSKLFGVKTKDEALALMLLASAEGVHPAVAARDFYIVDGKPSLKTDVMMARYLSAGGSIEFLQLTDAIAEAKFTPPGGGKPLTLTWTLEQATKAGLTNRDNWRKYPRSMLRSRVVSEGIRTTYPGVISGIYSVDELRDGVEEIDVTPAREANDSVRKTDAPIDVETVDTSTGEITGSQIPTVESTPEPVMPEGEVADHLSALEAAATLTDLKNAHARAYAAAHRVGDGKALLKFEVAKNAQKYKITKAGAAA